MNYIPTNLHTHYSLLRSFIKPDQLVTKLAEYYIPACCLTDFDVLSGSVKFFCECKEKGIKPILGTKIYVKTPDVSGYVTLLAQNVKGWKELISLSSMSYLPSRYVDRPSISFADLSTVKNCLVLVGTQESILFNSVFGIPSYTNPIVGSADVTNRLIDTLQSEFGERLFFQLERSNDCLASYLASDVIAEKARLHKIKTVAAPSPFYLNPGDKPDQLLLTATKLGCTLNQLETKTQELALTQYNQLLHKNFSLPHPTDMLMCHTEEEIRNTQLVSEMCESYNILGRPNLPRFQTPNGETEEELLKSICRTGWTNKIAGKIDPNRTKEYVARVLHELEVINGANLSGYFLIVQEYMNHAKKQGWLCSPGRGSSGGSIIAYLTDITTLDPVKHGLLFERFYNAGRNTADRVSLPDIDCDFPPDKRPLVAEHIREKYGRDNVGQVVTFSRLSGRGAIKEVLRATGACSHAEMDEITRSIAQEAEISDRLESDGESSILRWVLNNEPKSVERYAAMTDGELTGPLSHSFAQAIRIEGTLKSSGKHASALVISGEPLSDILPMVSDKSSNELLIGFEYEDAESMGCAKFDLLSISTLQKLMDINSLLRYGLIKE